MGLAANGALPLCNPIPPFVRSPFMLGLNVRPLHRVHMYATRFVGGCFVVTVRGLRPFYSGLLKRRRCQTVAPSSRVTTLIGNYRIYANADL